ncbi:methyltransferase domain-containing protein [Terrilactibacillus sp. S3-3]|nr:methyltransferase domain-containing protein [Terrilactibacillus sp. S3-3]
MNEHKYINFLAKLGIGSAHPGGRPLTAAILRDAAIIPGEKVLDVGCGTGETSIYLAEKYHADVTAIDLHPKMVSYAKKRALAANGMLTVMQADAEQLPFPGEQFDMILSESVTAFTHIEVTLQEYYRVLKQGGRLFAIEMTIEEPLPASSQEEIKALYGVKKLLTEDEWHLRFQQAGFSETAAFQEQDFYAKAGADPLPTYQLTNDIDEEALDVWLNHLQIMDKYKDLLSYRIYEVRK